MAAEVDEFPTTDIYFNANCLLTLMAADSNTSSVIWDSRSSTFRFQSSSLLNQYDRSIIAPLTLSQRKHYSHATVLQLPPLKLRSTLTWASSEEENFLSQSGVTTEREFELFKQKYDRLRATLSQSIQYNRHTYDKIQYRKSTALQTIHEREEMINRLLAKSFQLNEKLKQSKDDLNDQRQTRNNHEMQRVKLRRLLIQLDPNKDRTHEVLQTIDREKLIEEYRTRLLKLKNDQQEEINHRDQQIAQLKVKLSDEFNYQSDEHMKFLKATEQAYQLESQKCDILQEYVDDYEGHVYRARKPCCISTSHRLSKMSTQYRLYLIMELTLHELLRASCSCGSFQRSYQTYLRLHPN